MLFVNEEIPLLYCYLDFGTIESHGTVFYDNKSQKFRARDLCGN